MNNIEILSKDELLYVLHMLDIKNLYNACTGTNKRVKSICQEDNELRNRIYGYILIKEDIKSMSFCLKNSALNRHYNNLEAIKFLIKNGASVKSSGCSNLDVDVLRKASQGGNLDVVKYLIEEAKADINDRNILEAAAKNGHYEVVKYLIEKGAGNYYEPGNEIYNERSSKGNALIGAAHFGYLNIVKYLVEEGKADINYRESSALLFALRNKHYDIVEYLVEKGIIITDRILESKIKYREVYDYLLDHRVAQSGPITLERIGS